MSVRLAALASACVVVAAIVTGCGGGDSDDPGPAGQPTEQATETEEACPEGVRCFDFTEDAQGWPEVSDDDHFAGRDPYEDGTYRVGARQPGSWSLTAPVRVRELDADYGVQFDADATLGQNFPPGAAWGATCWTRYLVEDRMAGFAVQVQLDKVSIGHYDDETGEFEVLKELEAEGLTAPGEKTHLMLRCLQDASNGARIDVEVGGSFALSASVPAGSVDPTWEPSDRVGVLVAGKDADVFFDQFALSGVE